MRFSLLRKLQLIAQHPSQRRILALSAAIAVLFVVFGVFIYAPSRARMQAVRADLAQAQERVRELQSLVGLGSNIREGIRLVNEEYVRMDHKFPPGRESGSQLIPAFAEKRNIDIVSMKRFEAAACLGANGEPVVFNGLAVNRVPVSLVLKGLYNDIMQFILQMRQELPGFVSVDTLRVVADPAGGPKLDAVMDFNLYYLSGPNGR